MFSSIYINIFTGFDENWNRTWRNITFWIRRQGDISQHTDNRDGAGLEGFQGWTGKAEDGEDECYDRGWKPQAAEQCAGGWAEELEGRGERVQVQRDQASHRLLGARGGECSASETGLS